MASTLDNRFRRLCQQIEGYRTVSKYEHNYKITEEEQANIVPMNTMHRRIVSELDFCLQLRKHTAAEADAPITAALEVLEQALAAEGAITESACLKAEQCLMPLQKTARSYTLLLVGHAHLDMNWMWSWDETVATVVATFRTMLKLMKEYPQFCFSQSQASTYQLIEEYAPEMMDEIKQRIQEGRWEVTAGAWVETDKNMPCLESLMNHIVYTKKYLQEHWGIDPATLDLDFSPDTFGHSRFLPELDTLGEIKYYYHCRGLKDDDKVLYRWRAPSGKELLMYKEPYWYNSGITPNPAIGLPRMATLCGGLKTGMAVYGVGDHGGGPTRRDLEAALEMQKWPVFPTLKFGRLHDYFAAAEAVRNNVPLVEQELNFIFTGCYTTQSRVKKGNRRTEAALCTAETLAALNAHELGSNYPAAMFEKAWQKTLFTHFHDILTGSCVQDSREHAMGLYQDALSAAQTRSALALEELAAAIDTTNLADTADPTSRSEGAGVGFGVDKGNIPTQEGGGGLNRILHIINTTGTDRQENAELILWDWPGDLKLLELTDADGNPLPFEQIGKVTDYWAHRYIKLSVTVAVPAYGYTTVLVREREAEEFTNCNLYTVANDRRRYPYDDIVLENKYITAKFDKQSGCLYSLVEKESGKEYIKAGEAAGLRYIETQSDGMSAWVIGRNLSVQKVDTPSKIKLMPGKLCNGFTASYKIANSTAEVTVTLGSEDRHLKLACKVDWHEYSTKETVHPMLTYAVPLAVTAKRMLCEVPGGVQWREQQEQEVPCLRYSAAELEPGKTLAMLTDCKYGYRLADNILSVALINTACNPDRYPERGIQKINLYLAPATDDAVALAKLADTCLTPLYYVTNTAHNGTLPTTGSILQTESKTAIVTGIAQRNGSLTLRMYEAAGKECPVTVTLKTPATTAVLTNLAGKELNVPVTLQNGKINFTLAPYMQAELRIQ